MKQKIYEPKDLFVSTDCQEIFDHVMVQMEYQGRRCQELDGNFGYVSALAVSPEFRCSFGWCFSLEGLRAVTDDAAVATPRNLRSPRFSSGGEGYGPLLYRSGEGA